MFVTQSEQTDAAIALTEQKFNQQLIADTEGAENEPVAIALEQEITGTSTASEISITVNFDWGQFNPFDIIVSFIHLGDDVQIFQSPTQTYLIEADFLNAPANEITIEEFHFDDDTTVYLVGVQDTFIEIENALL